MSDEQNHVTGPMPEEGAPPAVPVEPAPAEVAAPEVAATLAEVEPAEVAAAAVAAPRRRMPFALVTAIILGSLLVATVVGGVAGVAASRWYDDSRGDALGISAASSTDEPVAAAASLALPSVVNIDVTGQAESGVLPGGHPDVPVGGTGSGVAYKAAPGGGTFIITNDHVVAGADSIVVTPADGERYDATLVGTDPETDIAVVRISKQLPLISVGDSEKLVVGQMVVAIGSPFGLQHSVSSGVVSAVHRSIIDEFSQDASMSAYPLVDVIQTDAAINPGNSGGALVDREGRLVGIDSAIYSDSGASAGVGFAIPQRTALRIADELIAGKKATHPFLGIQGMDVSAEEATRLGLAKAEGAQIESVVAGTGAQKAGLKADDVVTALDGQPVRTMNGLILGVRRTQVGDHVKLTVWRARAQITVDMTVGDKPS